MNNDEKDLLSGIKEMSDERNTSSGDNDVLINELFAQKKDPPKTNSAPKRNNSPRSDMTVPAAGHTGRPGGSPNGSPGGSPGGSPANRASQPSVPKKRQGRSDARYTMTPAEIETLASAIESAVANGRYGAALDSVFFTAGPAREALRDKLNIRIPIGSENADLPVIAAAALIESYLEYENINGEDIEEKLRLIIESSEDESKNHPTADQTDLRIFECALILCVQAELSGRHSEIKNRLYSGEDSFLCNFLESHINNMMKRHRNDIRRFYDSVKMESRVVSEVFGRYMADAKYSSPLPVRFFARSKAVLITAISAGVLCLLSVIFYIVGYSGSFMSFIATDNFLMMLVIVLEILFCAGMVGISWLVYVSGGED